MLRSMLLHCFLFLTFLCSAKTIIVKNSEELNEANNKAVPGDIIILQNGEWKSVTISLNCKGTKEKPITFKAQTPGKVLITGNSKLKIGGEYIVVDGFYFTNGYAGKDDVINFRIDNKQLANNCRVTNTVIDDFNNTKRIDENNWVSLYGKNNRIDHCSFINKLNLGVLLAVLLDDDRSRENFHSIDHNYFGKRLPLASNGGEIIRIGLSQHCQFNSNTEITNNFFDQCDGEAEVISIKSCSNKVEKNVFRECQGAVVLRHGNNNKVAGNYFLGNDKPGTGGIRIINKGQNVVNNIFYKCRGEDFRSPLVIMNGVPNSPPTRYVQVTDALIMGNSFYECSPISFCEGSDAERTLPPDKVTFSGNSFYNTRDSIIYKTYDKIDGIKFGDNKVSINVTQQLADGFEKTTMSQRKKLSEKEMFAIEHPSVDNIPAIEKKLFNNCGAGWYKKSITSFNKKPLTINCATVEAIYKQLENKDPVIIKLTGPVYSFTRPMIISKNVEFTGDKYPILFKSDKMSSLFIVTGKGNLAIKDLIIIGVPVMATHFISSDSTGSSDHYSLSIINSTISEIGKGRGCVDIFHAYKSTIADSIIIRNSQFLHNDCDFINMNEEKDDKGYYNVEKIFIGHNRFLDQSGALLDIYRGGVDESTLGPYLTFSHNSIEDCKSNDAFIKLTGVQQTEIFSNQFSNCNPSGDLITYKDLVRARHYLGQNKISNSGKIEKDKYVKEK